MAQIDSVALFAPSRDPGSGIHPRAGSDIQFLGNNLQLAAIPVITFYFATNKGFPTEDLPNSISIHLPGAGISISSLQNFSTEENIVGASIAGTLNPNVKGMLEGLQATGQMLGSSIIRQVIQGLAGAGGFALSAGGAGVSQVEFLLRQTLNSFQQLIYKGPTHRVFQLPFNMKPSSPREAEDVRDIVLAFRMASSPSIGTFELDENMDSTFKNEATLSDRIPDEEEEITEERQRALDQLAISEASALLGPEPLTFNYPNMTLFSLDLYLPSSDNLIRLFESEFCVMTALNVDYGENKLNFFKESNGKYYPTETTLSLSLTEHIHYFKENATRSHDRGFTIL